MTAETGMATTSSAPKLVDPAAYNKVVGSLLLRDIRLTKSEFSIEAEATKFQPEWRVKHTCDIHEINFTPERDLLLVWVVADVACKLKNKKIISSRCKYLVAYDVHGEASDDVVHHFAKRVARFAAYPYFRSHFAELTSQAGIHMPPLPVLKEAKPMLGPAVVRDQPPAIEAKREGD